MIHIDFITRGKVSTCISTLKSYSEVKPQFPVLHASPNTANIQGAREWAMDWVRCDRHGEEGPQEAICSQPGRGWQQPHCSLEQGAPNGEASLSLIYTTPVSSSDPNRFLLLMSCILWHQIVFESCTGWEHSWHAEERLTCHRKLQSMIRVWAIQSRWEVSGLKSEVQSPWIQDAFEAYWTIPWKWVTHRPTLPQTKKQTSLLVQSWLSPSVRSLR